MALPRDPLHQNDAGAVPNMEYWRLRTQVDGRPHVRLALVWRRGPWRRKGRDDRSGNEAPSGGPARETKVQGPGAKGEQRRGGQGASSSSDKADGTLVEWWRTGRVSTNIENIGGSRRVSRARQGERGLNRYVVCRVTRARCRLWVLELAEPDEKCAEGTGPSLARNTGAPDWRCRPSVTSGGLSQAR